MPSLKIIQNYILITTKLVLSSPAYSTITGLQHHGEIRAYR